MENAALASEQQLHHCEKRLRREQHRKLEKCIAPMKSAPEEKQFRADLNYISKESLRDIEDFVNELRTGRERSCGVTNIRAQGRQFFIKINIIV